MQNRRAFVKTTCGLAACSCCAATLLAQEQQAGPKKDEAPVDVGQLKWKLGASERRFAWLLELMDAQLSKKAKTRLLEALGRRCAGEYMNLADKHKGDLKGYLDEIRKQWVDKVEWADDGKSFQVFDKPRPCTCPLVGAGNVSSTMCACSLGWQKEIYSRISGGPVQVTVEKSVLRGDPQCVFRIRLGKDTGKD
jgi:predicted hydrocarbon binding protein